MSQHGSSVHSNHLQINPGMDFVMAAAFGGKKGNIVLKFRVNYNISTSVLMQETLHVDGVACVMSPYIFFDLRLYCIRKNMCFKGIL